jgi:hypothetical protein
VGDEIIEAGETFEAADEDVESLLANPEIRLAEGSAPQQDSSSRRSHAQPSGTAPREQLADAGGSDTSSIGDN